MEFPSDALLLSTKLKIPAPRKNYVVRKALFEELSLCADMSVIFVRGGAGTGKTTLLSSFIRETGLENVCWVSLDASNTDVYSFWLYFIAAVSVFWDDGDEFLALVRSNPDASHMENILTLLINRLAGDKDYYMALDDMHCISDPALIRMFEFFLGAMPSNFHFFMLSREDPPVYLGPLAMSGRLLFIDGIQMQLTPEEGMAFLKQTLKMKESDEVLARLNTYAEGWIGGLQLAAATGASEKYGQLLRAGGGIAAEYLTREIFESLTPEEKAFLIKTGFLSYFDSGICSSIFDNFTKADFDRMMDDLVCKNLFIICIDEDGGVYRYHNILLDYLFQQFQRLPEEKKLELYTKSAVAFERRGDYEEALQEYCAAEDYANVMRVARGMNGRVEAWSYLDKIPLNLLIEDADLAAQCFLFNMGNLNLERCRILFDKFKENYGGSDIFSVVQFVEAYISQNDHILMSYHALTAGQIERLHLSPVVKASVLIENAAALVELMQYKEAENCVESAIQTCAGANIFVDFFAYNELAQVYEETGRLNDSLLCYEKSQKLLDSPSMMSWYGSNYYFGLIGVYMRRMELGKADEILKKVKDLMDSQPCHIDITDITLLHHEAEMRFLSGNDEAGVAYVEGILTEYPSLRETDEILTFSRLHANKLRLVEAGLQKIYMLTKTDDPSEKREIMNLLLEAIHYAQKDRIIMPFYLERRVLLPQLPEKMRWTRGRHRF